MSKAYSGEPCQLLVFTDQDAGVSESQQFRVGIKACDTSQERTPETECCATVLLVNSRFRNSQTETLSA